MVHRPSPLIPVRGHCEVLDVVLPQSKSLHLYIFILVEPENFKEDQSPAIPFNRDDVGDHFMVFIGVGHLGEATHLHEIILPSGCLHPLLDSVMLYHTSSSIFDIQYTRAGFS